MASEIKALNIVGTPTEWFNGTIKEYSGRIKLDDGSERFVMRLNSRKCDSAFLLKIKSLWSIEECNAVITATHDFKQSPSGGGVVSDYRTSSSSASIDWE